MKTKDSLIFFRNQIDEIDKKIISLIQSRARVVEKVGDFKRKHSIPITNLKREKEIYRKISKLNQSPLSNRAILQIYQNIILQCRMHEAFHESKKLTSLNRFRNVGIIGVGLMGGSIGLALKQKYNVIGFDKVQNKNLGFEIELKPTKVFQSDLIILCLSVYQNLEFIKKYKNQFSKNTVILDIASTKEFYKDEIKKLKSKNQNLKNIPFVFGHPLAGKAQKGSKYSEREIFYNQKFILCNFDKLNKNLQLKIKTLIEDLCMKLEISTTKDHDQMLAFTSHLVQLISTTLANVTSHKFKKPIHGPAFEQMTRLAQSDASVWYPIIKSNEKYVVSAIIDMIAGLSKIKSAIKNKNKFYKEFLNAQKFMKR